MWKSMGGRVLQLDSGGYDRSEVIGPVRHTTLEALF